MSASIVFFFETCGRFFFQRVGLPIFLVLISVIPICTGLFLYLEKQKVSELKEQRTTVMKRAKTAFERKERKEVFIQEHTNSDPYFLDKEIESFVFLKNEKNRLASWLAHPAIANKEKIMKRLSFLGSEENRLSFTEDDIQTSKTCKETMEKQRSPVELDCDDLKQLLSLIEDLPAESVSSTKRRPQLLISNFSLSKKKTILQSEVFEMKMDLLKREFLSP